jgi:hypothetical protein
VNVNVAKAVNAPAKVSANVAAIADKRKIPNIRDLVNPFQNQLPKVYIAIGLFQLYLFIIFSCF